MILRLVVAVIFAVFLTGGSAVFAGGDGLAIFQANKCTKCHTLKKAGISAVIKSADSEEEAEEGEEEDKAPDLSKLSEQVTKSAEGSEAHIVKFLKKEVAHKGKKHKQRFKGTDAELQTLAKYLAGGK
ncbi:MAG: c-type cytochrome [Deltaproteobacteria bacterium]|nr:c-type cytochrome [Deltaproteobacteria bacterium]